MRVTSLQSQHEDKTRNVGASGAVENNNKVFLVIIKHECDNKRDRIILDWSTSNAMTLRCTPLAL